MHVFRGHIDIGSGVGDMISGLIQGKQGEELHELMSLDFFGEMNKLRPYEVMEIE